MSRRIVRWFWRIVAAIYVAVWLAGGIAAGLSWTVHLRRW